MPAPAGLLASVAMALPPDDVTRVLEPLRARLGACAVLLDLDGTLAAIRQLPEEVAIAPEMRDALRSLAARAGLVAFVSGRALADLERIVGIAGCAYAGNHGMEIRRADGAREVAAPARPHLERVAAFAGSLDTARLTAAGAWLEDKGVTLSFHYRTAGDEATAIGFLESEIVPRAEAAGLRVTHGRKVLEVRPPVDVNKGTAVRQLVTASGCRLATYLGDDATDVDAWAALRLLADEGGIESHVAVAVVGNETPAAVREAADVVLDGVGGALELVKWLAGPGAHRKQG